MTQYTPPNLASMPLELVAQIFATDAATTGRAARVCRSWRDTVNTLDNGFWIGMAAARFGADIGPIPNARRRLSQSPHRCTVYTAAPAGPPMMGRLWAIPDGTAEILSLVPFAVAPLPGPAGALQCAPIINVVTREPAGVAWLTRHGDQYRVMFDAFTFTFASRERPSLFPAVETDGHRTVVGVHSGRMWCIWVHSHTAIQPTTAREDEGGGRRIISLHLAGDDVLATTLIDDCPTYNKITHDGRVIQSHQPLTERGVALYGNGDIHNIDHLRLASFNVYHGSSLVQFTAREGPGRVQYNTEQDADRRMVHVCRIRSRTGERVVRRYASIHVLDACPLGDAGIAVLVERIDAKTADAKTADAKTADAKTADAKTADAKTASASATPYIEFGCPADGTWRTAQLGYSYRNISEFDTSTVRLSTPDHTAFVRLIV